MKIAEKHALLNEAVAAYEKESGVHAQTFRQCRPGTAFVKRLAAFRADVDWYERHTGAIHQQAKRAVSRLENLF